MAQNSDEDTRLVSQDDSKQESDEASESKAESDKQVLAAVKSFFKVVSDAEKEIRDLALDDLNFRAGEQWPTDIKNERALDKRPCLVINRLPQFIKQITNDQRQNRPSIKVDPVDDKGDVDTAEIYQGLIRHIEYNSNADFAYDTAFESAVVGGFGYFRIVTNYVDPTSFDQEILIKRIRNPFTVYFDPTSTEPDGSDANQCLIIEDLLKEDYERQYPDSQLASAADLKSIGDNEPDWLPDGKMRIAEYFYKTYRSTKVWLLDNGSVVEVKDEKDPPPIPEGTKKINERMAQVPVIKWCKVNAIEILEEQDWPGIWIPVVPVFGDEIDVDGKLIREGIVRHAKDPQRMYNYWASSKTETIALAPRSPFVIAEGQVEGYESIWKEANRKSHAYLPYKQVDLRGQPAPPPQRQVFEAPVQSITQAMMQAADDIKSTTGIYDAALGNKSNESSGVAIQRRNAQTQTSNFHFIDNLSRSLRHTGRILVDLIPKIYDTKRSVRIIGADGQQEITKINQVFQDEDGKKKMHVLSAGKYDVIVDTGPSFATKRQEAVTSMLDLVKTAPQVMQVAGDLLVGNMDWHGAKDIAERLRKTLPPGVADDPNNKEPMPPQAMAAINQFRQQNQILTQHLNEKTQIIEQKQIETQQKKMELDSKERIANSQMMVEVEITLAKMKAQGSQVLLQAELSELHNKLKLASTLAPYASDLADSDLTNQDPNLIPNSGNAGSTGAAAMPQPPTGGQSPGNTTMGNT